MTDPVSCIYQEPREHIGTKSHVANGHNMHIKERYNNRPLTGVRDALRIRHNTIKRMNISNAVECVPSNEKGVRVLDIGCGQGGDIHKWTHENLDIYIGIDHSENSILKASQRASKLGTRARFNFLQYDAFSFFDELAEDQKFHIISVQFVINYILNTHDKLELFFQNCRRHLLPGGVIIGSSVDHSKVMKLLDKQENGYFSLQAIDEIPEDKQLSLGFRYLFSLSGCIDSCIEHIVPWDDIAKCAVAHELHVGYCTNFKDIEKSGLSKLSHEQKTLTGLYNSFKIVNVGN